MAQSARKFELRQDGTIRETDPMAAWWQSIDDLERALRSGRPVTHGPANNGTNQPEYMAVLVTNREAGRTR